MFHVNYTHYNEFGLTSWLATVLAEIHVDQRLKLKDRFRPIDHIFMSWRLPWAKSIWYDM